jgi:hypothetical protein
MTLGGWTALGLPSVRRPYIESALRDLGTEWTSASHVTATTTLARAIRSRGQVGLPLATLLDLVLMPSLRGGMALPLAGFPGPEVLVGDHGERRYLGALASWQGEASGRRLLTGVRFDDSLRGFVREEAQGRVGRALLASRRALATTVHTLVAAGVRPEGLRPTAEIGAAAARAWARAEQEIAWLGDPRENLWLDFDEVEQGSTRVARDLVDRVRAALDVAFGSLDGRRTVVHHGFYFYTPPQWAMFQVLRRVPGVDQVFVVHDDGRNPAFSSWRHYFRSDLVMPVPQRIASAAEPASAAAAFRAVLQGEGACEPEGLRVVECRSPAELVRTWSESSPTSEEDDFTRYAAAAEQVERYVQRLGRSSRVSSPPLSQLPVGSFLLAVHRCIAPRVGGSPEVRLDGDALLDVVSSGYLDVGVDRVVSAALVRRALPYFADCVSGEEWVERAALLARTVRERVSPLGARDPQGSDVDRIATAVFNPTRLVPWADLSVEEADHVGVAVLRVVKLVEEIASRERVRLGDHLRLIHGKLQRALGALPEQEREAIEAKIRGFGTLADEEIDLDGLVDVVAMLVGRTADLDPGVHADDDPAATSVKQLRGLDSLGLDRVDHDLHLANLAEDVFPTSGRVVGWPFTLDDLRQAGDDAAEPVAIDLLSTRAATATLGDLYLLWLALDGVEPGREIILSWVSETNGDHRRLSPIVALLTEPDFWSQAVRECAGGVLIEPARGPADLPPTARWLPPADVAVDDAEVEDALDMVSARATASAYACSRRFAIQWGVGPSAAFGPEHLQGMLFGNVLNSLHRAGLAKNAIEAFAIATPLWPQLTDGQRASSLERAPVKVAGQSANPVWALTLGGKKDGTGRLDKAYESARTGVRPDGDVVAPPGATYLPLGVEQRDAEVCGRCPVQARCAQWRDPGRWTGDYAPGG